MFAAETADPGGPATSKEEEEGETGMPKVSFGHDSIIGVQLEDQPSVFSNETKGRDTLVSECFATLRVDAGDTVYDNYPEIDTNSEYEYFPTLVDGVDPADFCAAFRDVTQFMSEIDATLVPMYDPRHIGGTSYREYTFDKFDTLLIMSEQAVAQYRKRTRDAERVAEWAEGWEASVGAGRWGGVFGDGRGGAVGCGCRG